jgi:hypothetical protein
LYILSPLCQFYFGIFNGVLVYFTPFWYIFPHFGMLHPETSGNPAPAMTIAIVLVANRYGDSGADLQLSPTLLERIHSVAKFLFEQEIIFIKSTSTSSLLLYAGIA